MPEETWTEMIAVLRSREMTDSNPACEKIVFSFLIVSKRRAVFLLS